MNTQKYREIGAAGCCGAVAGTAVAIVCDWSILMLLPAALIGAVTAFVCYSPREVASIIGAFGCDMGGAMRRGMKERCGKVWEAVRQHAFPAVCIAIVIGSAFLLPTLLAMGGIHVPTEGKKGHPVWLVVFVEALLSLGFGVMSASLCWTTRENEERWPMPLTQRLNGRMDAWLGDDWGLIDATMNRGKWLLFCLIGPPFLQVMGIVMATMLVVDVILTILLACASSERIAAVLGATLGFCAGTVLHFCGVPGSLAGSLVILAASGAVGWFAGPLLYRLRAYLEWEPAAETVRSS